MRRSRREGAEARPRGLIERNRPAAGWHESDGKRGRLRPVASKRTFDQSFPHVQLINEGALSGLILCGIWGSTWLFIKLGLADLPPLTFAGIRFLLAGLILTAIVLARRVRWPRAGRDWALIAIVGFLQFTLNYGLVFWGEQHISSGLAAVLQSTFPAFGLVIAHLYLPHERITLLKVMGVLMGIVGIAIIFSDQLTVAGHMALLGSIALVLSAFFGAYGNVLVAYSQKMTCYPLRRKWPAAFLY